MQPWGAAPKTACLDSLAAGDTVEGVQHWGFSPLVVM
jgi:hypothetical protein